ncbi:MAG: hypothetical protein H7070_08125 [Saprospiraceae bacterium]|nr:hypothetical protein [Pyrinomonadaceae bacterium]
MNSEELERSLRTEFESYLKGVTAGMRQDVSDFQKNFEAEFEKHKAQLDEAFRALSARFESDNQFDQAFVGSVVEHLRLARDEGAEIAATAFGEAEKLADETAPAAKFDQMRDAIDEISRKTTQSEILTSLVNHAANFTPRGAFFIVKNDRFVGWRVFGKEGNADDAAVREIQFPISSDTILADAISSLSIKESSHGGHAEDPLFLEPLNFSRPDRMYAIPLTARGRGVAVLYADYGAEGVSLNAEALETLVRVAGLTVELLAASQTAAVQQEASETPASFVPAESESAYSYEAPAEDAYEEPAREEEITPEYADLPVAAEHEEIPEIAAEPEETYEVESFDREENLEPEAEPVQLDTVEEYQGEVSYDAPVAADSYLPEPIEEEDSSAFAFVETDELEKTSSVETGSIETVSYFEQVEDPVEESVMEETAAVEEISYFETETEPEVVEPAIAASAEEPEFVSADSFETAQNVEVEPGYAVPVEGTNGYSNGSTPAAVVEPVVEVAAAQQAKSRFSDRNMDLPIEVPEDERRLHNDARRFARLLVSEIKLYNEQKVTEGRESADLYDRLRDAIDRSRDMYSKRVQPPVASKFDYFHYELVNSLAEGDDTKLGENYPGVQA